MSKVVLLVLGVLLMCVNTLAFARSIPPQYMQGDDVGLHRWYAGSPYVGQVEAGGFTWDCANGRCVLAGPYGTGLNMAVCQDLAQKVGGLTYYYNDAGKWWTKHESPRQLRECNHPHRPWFGLR
jgi:hypothetical protein